MLALVCFVVLVVFITGFRMTIQRIRTGDHGLRVTKQFRSKSARLALYLQLLAIGLFVLVLLLNALNLLKPHLNWGFAGSIFGLGICAIGTLLTMIAQFQMGSSWRIGVDDSEQTELVTEKLFSLSRNPIYVGVLIVGIGFVVLVPHFMTLFCWLIAAIGIHLQVTRVEEPHLHQVFGDAYSGYRENVNRYFPTLWAPSGDLNNKNT